jgi:hypothetical protein
MQPDTVPLPVLVFVALILCAVLLGVHRRREGIRYKLRRNIIAISVYLFAAYILSRNGQPLGVAIAIGVLAGIGAEVLLVKPRSRHIPRTEKRKAIADYERRTSRKFNPKKDELDHDVAFARLGSSTADNLRVRPRAENRRKGKKRVWWDVLGG